MDRKRPAPRNPFVAAAKFKKAGAHGKSEKAMRRAVNVKTQREYGVAVAQHPFKVPGLGSIPSAPTISSLLCASVQGVCVRLLTGNELGSIPRRTAKRNHIDQRGQQRAAEIPCKDLV